MSVVFSSPAFLFLFLPLILCVYYNPIFKSRAFKNYSLLLFSLAFYGWGEPVFVFVMVSSIVINWYFALKIDQHTDIKKRKCFLFFPILFDIGLIFTFKYLVFVLQNLGYLFGTSSIDLDIALPIGISFFTFQIMSYVFDVYRSKAPVQKNVLDVGLYISLFPQLIAGPIVRYETVANEINHRTETYQDFTAGVTRFVFGLGKKVLLANYVGLIADNIFAVTSSLSATTAWLGIIAYALQIYYDFSGYSDMAIGLGRMFGFHFLENFNFPYIANSVTDFWRRWHISLGTWFRDYVYIPIGGSKTGTKKLVFNLFAVWLLTGIWHGANWTFIIWGLYYFAFLTVEKLTRFHEKLGPFSHLYTLLVVLIGWVIFRAESLTRAFQYLGFMFSIGASVAVDELFFYYFSNGKWVLLAAVVCCIPIVQLIRSYSSKEAKISESKKSNVNLALSIGRTIFMLAVFVLAVMVCVNSTYNPFIYFNF